MSNQEQPLLLPLPITQRLAISSWWGSILMGRHSPSSISDTQGNTFVPVGSQLTSPEGTGSRVYYAKNIAGGADTVTVHWSVASTDVEMYLVEYSGLDPNNPVDAQAGATGTAGAVSSGNATTTVAGDVIYGYCMADKACKRARASRLVRPTIKTSLKT